MDKRSPNLAKIIALDLLTVGFWQLFLLVTIFASAMGVVFITHHTREAVTEKDMALVERERLDNEWRNLILEETALAEHSRVETVAISDLEMKRPDSDKEVIVNLP